MAYGAQFPPKFHLAEMDSQLTDAEREVVDLYLTRAIKAFASVL